MREKTNRSVILFPLIEYFYLMLFVFMLLAMMIQPVIQRFRRLSRDSAIPIPTQNDGLRTLPMLSSLAAFPYRPSPSDQEQTCSSEAVSVSDAPTENVSTTSTSGSTRRQKMAQLTSHV